MTDIKNDKTDAPFDPKADPKVTKDSGIGPAPSAWNPTAKPLDGSPVLTAVPPPPGTKSSGVTKQLSVAEHNAYVLSLSKDAY